MISRISLILFGLSSILLTERQLAAAAVADSGAAPSFPQLALKVQMRVLWFDVNVIMVCTLFYFEICLLSETSCHADRSFLQHSTQQGADRRLEEPPASLRETLLRSSLLQPHSNIL